jgi:uracil-DNA glycosylase
MSTAAPSQSPEPATPTAPTPAPGYASLSPEEWRDAPVVLRTGAEPGPQPGRAWYRVPCIVLDAVRSHTDHMWVEGPAGQRPTSTTSQPLDEISQRAAEAVWSYWREQAEDSAAASRVASVVLLGRTLTEPRPVYHDHAINGLEQTLTADHRAGCFGEGLPPALPVETEEVKWEPWRLVLRASRLQAAALAHLTGADFGHPQGAVLHTTTYAEAAWSRYLRLAARPGCALVVGQNPGPRGAMQTGVPFTDPPTLADLFGETDAARLLAQGRPPVEQVGSWRYRGDVKAPREESARRLWPVMREALGVAGSIRADDRGRVLETFFCVNATPIGILDAKGRNVSAESVGGAAAELVERTSLEWLRAVIDILRPAVVISVGNWARDHLAAVPAVALGHRLHLRHPSPLAGGSTEWARDAAPVLRRAAELVREGRAGGAPC